MAPTPLPCACGKPVTLTPHTGGRGCGDVTSYQATCASCGVLFQELCGTSCTGRKADATREYNKLRREGHYRMDLITPGVYLPWPSPPQGKKGK